MRRIAVVITARPSYARIQTVLEALRADPRADVRLIMAASSLLHHYGNVADTIPFPISHKVYATLDGHNLQTSAIETGLLTQQLAHVFAAERPDVVVTIADRHETIATAIAASYQNIPLAHLQGGEDTGNIDQKVRYAISMMADLHFPATARAAERLNTLGVNGSIFPYGCPSVDLAARATYLPEYADTIVVLQHPVTTEVESAYDQIEETYQAVGQFLSGYRVLWFWPGQDAGTEDTAKHLRENIAHRESHRRNGGGIEFVRNLVPLHFLSILRSCAVLVGNSSVGIRESAYLGLPVVDVGTRQNGRERERNVLGAPYVRGAIERAVDLQLKHGRYERSHLYGRGDAGQRIAAALIDPQGVAVSEHLECRACA